MENERMTETKTDIEIATEPTEKKKTEIRFEDLPRLEDLLKSEKEIKSAQELKGLKQVEEKTLAEDKPFTMKQDEKKTMVKKRVKIFTGVYIAVVALLLTFIGINIATLTIMDKDINSNANTIQSQSQQIDIYEGLNTPDADPTGTIEISLNEPRDYSDDTKELTFFDKLTILFRNIFS